LIRCIIGRSMEGLSSELKNSQRVGAKEHG